MREELKRFLEEQISIHQTLLEDAAKEQKVLLPGEKLEFVLRVANVPFVAAKIEGTKKGKRRPYVDLADQNWSVISAIKWGGKRNQKIVDIFQSAQNEWVPYEVFVKEFGEHFYYESKYQTINMTFRYSGMPYRVKRRDDKEGRFYKVVKIV